MSEKITFRSKSRSHRIKSSGLEIRFVNHVYSTTIPGEIDLLRKRAAAANSMIREMKPEEKVTVKVEKAGVTKAASKGKVDPESLDVPGAEAKK